MAAVAASGAQRRPLREVCVELRVEVRPCGPFRMPLRGGMDGVLRRRGRVLERLLHDGEEPVVVRVAQTAPDCVLFGARARGRAAAEYGIARMRFALGVDDDLEGFRRRFARDPLIGPSVRRRPWLRVTRRPEPFEALAWAICEQLIEYERAAAIERRVVARLGRRRSGWHGIAAAGRHGIEAVSRHGIEATGRHGIAATGRHVRPDRGAGDPRGLDAHRGGAELRDLPTPATLAGVAPALLQSFDLGGSRARTLVHAAREVARGRIDLHHAEHERAWRRLRAIPGIGPWTVEMLALRGQGRYDQVPAGDVGLLKLVGRALADGDPYARADEAQVRAFFAPYGAWAGLAAAHLIGLA
jgi:3-methyladenine DNA glycosylase/8-oxoguanine DNA glycosylase